ERHQKLFLDGQAVQPSKEDRHAHAYVFTYLATGRKLCLLLNPPPREDLCSGTLEVAIAPLPGAELAKLQQDQAQQDARLAQEQRQRAREEAERARQEQERLAYEE